MKVGILHLSDLHFAVGPQKIDKKFNALNSLVLSESYDISKLFIVISGDIAFSGKKEEYDKVKILLDYIGDGLEVPIEKILVPGNHDCNFDRGNQLRTNTIASMDYDTVGNDSSVIDHCLNVQQDFWSFYETYHSIPENKLLYYIDHKVENWNIRFNCINSAWMSAFKEKPGTLFLPVKNFDKKNNKKNISISVMHHPFNWFTPETEENNRKEIEKYLMSISTLQLFGHEHQPDFVGQHDYETNLEALQFYGDIFHDSKKPKKSGFQYIKIDLAEETGELIKYELKSDLYIGEPTKEFKIVDSKEKDFNFNPKFLNYLEKINIPLSGNGKSIKLSDIYIYPHLDPINLDQQFVYSYIESNEILNNSDIKNWVLAGESQVGKTSLLKKLCHDLYSNGYYPILVKGKEIKDLKVTALIKRKFKKTYVEKGNNFNQFNQYDFSKKVLLIDDFQNSKLDITKNQKLFTSLSKLFGKIIIAIDGAGSVLTQIRSNFESFTLFSIKPLGFKKTNDLIVKYHSHFQNPITLERQTFLNQVRYKFDQVCTVLGNRIVPSCPIFLLSILQSLDNTSLDLSKTSYGYCYHSLIHTALTVHAKIINDDIDTYINFLKKFSYHLYKNKTEEIDEDGFIAFYHDYKKIYHFPAYSQAKAKLIASQIIIEEDSNLRFGYKYILLYLAAQHISDIINTVEGKKVLTHLFENLHIATNANILVFITHHTNDISFMHDSLFHAMVPFENISPITLEKDDPFYSHIGDISKSISNTLINQKRTPEEERERQLVKRDDRERKLEQQSEHQDIPEEVQKAVIPYIQASASIDIIGQIVKNRKGSLKKKEIIELIKESYFTGFRSISSIGGLFTEIKDLLAEETAKTLKSSDSKEVVERKINSFIQLLSLHSCLGVFAKLIYSVGLRDFQDVYSEVASQIDSPAAKIVSFSINSYHNQISVSEVKALVKEIKNNPVAMFIVRDRVKNYIYQNYVEHSTQQSLAQLLDMKLSPFKSIRLRRITR